MADKRASSELPLDLPDLPPDWSYKPLGTLVDDRGISYGIVQPGKHEPDGIPIIRVNNIKNGHISGDDALRVSTDIEASYERTRLRGGEVLLTLVGSLGEAGIVPPQFAGWNVARAVGVIPVEPDPGSRWVALCLRSQLAQRHIQMWATTTVQATFNLRDVARLPIPIPPKREREAIAHILGTLDDKIELNRRMNETLEAMARAIFKSWFVNFDPVRAKMDGCKPLGMDAATAALFSDSFQESELGHIPIGWTTGTLGEICVFVRRTVQPSQFAVDTPYIGLEHMPRRAITLGEWGHAGDVDSAKAKFERGEILFGKLRPYFHKVGIAPFDGVCSTDILTIAPKEDGWLSFALFHLSSDEVIDHADACSTGTKMPRVNAQDLARYEIAIPPAKLAVRFDAIARPMLERCIIHTTESRTLAAIRDALLPKLLSGGIVLSEP
jgi:type I restriction enzyme S subunit